MPGGLSPLPFGFPIGTDNETASLCECRTTFEDDLYHQQQFRRPQVFPATNVRRSGHLRFRQRWQVGHFLYQRRADAGTEKDESLLLQLPPEAARRRDL